MVTVLFFYLKGEAESKLYLVAQSRTTGPQHTNCCPHRLIQSGKEDKSISDCFRVPAPDLDLIEGRRCQPREGNCVEPRMCSSIMRQRQKCSANARGHNDRLSVCTLPRKMPWVFKLHKETPCPAVIKIRLY